MALSVGVHTQPLVERVLAAMDQASVSWCLLRGSYPRPAANDDAGDVDLLVDRRHLQRADAVFRALGFGRIPAWGHGAHRFYLTYDRASDQWLKLDLDAEISYGRYEELPTGVESACLARRERIGHAWALAPDDTFWALLLHCLLDKRGFRPDHQRELEAVVNQARDDGTLAMVVARYCPVGWSPRHMLDAVEVGDWGGLLSIAADVERRWRAEVGAFATRRVVVHGAQRRATKLLNLTRRRGLSVALLGPDGAGKSTLAEGIRASFYFPVRQVYMGLYQRGAGSDRSGVLGLGCRLATQWQRFLSASYHQSRGRLVVFDRHGHDQRLAPAAREPLKRRVRRWLLAHASPPPDLALVLDAPGTVLYARKGEHSPDYLEAQRQKFRALAQRLENLEIVDVTRDPDEVRRDVLERIWRRYAARWS